MKTTFISMGLLSILLITVCSKCKKVAMDYSYEINIVNNADHSIGYYFANGGKFGTLFPDTTLPETNEYITYDIEKILRPGLEHHYSSWEKYFKHFPSDTLSVYIFHTDTLQNNSWKEIRDNYKILKRYDLSLEDLHRMNWTITYP